MHDSSHQRGNVLDREMDSWKHLTGKFPGTEGYIDLLRDTIKMNEILRIHSFLCLI